MTGECIMEIGKVPNSILKNIVLDKIKNTREEILIRPSIGEDCSAVDFGENVCVLSSDPITGAVKEVGRLCVHISCNDIASSGAEPLGLLVTILMPEDSSEKDLEEVMNQICNTASSLKVDILGGHTEVTKAVNRFVIITTGVGKVHKNGLVHTSGAKAGDDIILTKSAGIEGVAIIAHEKDEELIPVLGDEIVNSAKGLMDKISVVKEGIIAGKFGVNSMHDITEGGVLGALWEVLNASEKGAFIEKDKIPVAEETIKICEFYGIDPLKLISSGCMLITCNNGTGLLKEFEENGIEGSIIGKVTGDGIIRLSSREGCQVIDEPLSDELYKVI